MDGLYWLMRQVVRFLACVILAWLMIRAWGLIRDKGYLGGSRFWLRHRVGEGFVRLGVRIAPARATAGQSRAMRRIMAAERRHLEDQREIAYWRERHREAESETEAMDADWVQLAEAIGIPVPDFAEDTSIWWREAMRLRAVAQRHHETYAEFTYPGAPETVLEVEQC